MQNTPKTIEDKWVLNAKYLIDKLKQQNFKDAKRHFVDFTKSALSEQDRISRESAKKEVLDMVEEEAVKVCNGDDDCIDNFTEIWEEIKQKLSTNKE